MSGVWKILLGLIVAVLVLYAPDAAADLTSADPAGKGILDEVKDRFVNAAMMWRGVILDYATWLFWLLVTINLVWTFGMMALQKADLPDFFREFIKFTITTGFFWWILLNGPVMATDIYQSMMQIGADAGGLPNGLSPSSIIDIGFEISAHVNNVLTIWDPIDSLVVILAGVAILIVLALVAINMLLLLISAYILAYAGFFFVAFGGAMWTRDMAINFLKTALGLGVQLMGMVLIVGIGEGFLRFFAGQMSGEINFSELTVMLVICIVLLVLSNKVPALLAGIITGASVGGQGIGSFGAGAAVGAAAAVATMGSMAAAAAKVGAANAAGGASAISAAFKEAQQHMQSGTGMFAGAASAMAGMGSGSGGSSQDYQGGSSGGGSSDTPKSAFASAMSSGMSALKTGATFAADMGANLGRGAMGTAREGVASKLDQAKEAIGQSAMGQVASEIKSPGAAREERHDNKAIAAAEEKQSAAERKDKAAEARAFLSGDSGGGSIGGAADSGDMGSVTSGAGEADSADSGNVDAEQGSNNTAQSTQASSAASGMGEQPSTDTGNVMQQQPLNEEVAEFMNKHNGERKDD